MSYGFSKVGAYEPIKRKSKKSKNKNNGGILGGAEYLVNSALAGIGGVGEGIVDLFSAAGAAISGDLEYAKYVFKDNVVGDWHEDITEEYNPDAVWKFGGDVAHGLGQSSWFLLNLIPGANWVGTAAFGAGMVGQGISGAAEQTGDVGLKEVGYGVTTAAIETTLGHFLSGTSTLAKNIGGSIAKSTGKSALKSIASSATRKGLVKSILSDAAGEFAEEFISEYTDTFLQRAYQIDPDAEYSLKNALYSGFVGAVSGSVSAGTGDVVNAVSNQQRGARIIKNGNSQTLVNTANLVADKLAGSGTNFKNAPQWVKTLRGEVDAYNKLAAKGQQNSLSGQTILGEMQASLFFAEMQVQNAGIQEGIQNSSDENRAALAEYVNRAVDKSKRKKDFTAEDIAKNTDDVAKQLAIMKQVGYGFDIDGAIYGATTDMAQESAVESVIAEERSGQLGIDAKYSFEGYAEDGKGMYKSNFPKGTPKTAKSKVILDYIQNVWSKNPITLKINENGQTRDVVAQFDPTYSEDTRFKSDASKLMGGNRHGTASDQRVTLDLADDYYQIASEAEYNYSKDETGKDTPTHEGVRKWHYFVNNIYFSEFDSDDYRPYRVTINVKEKSDGNFVYSFSAEAQEGSSTPQTLHAVVSDDKVTANAQPSKPIIHQNEPVVNSESKKNIVKHDLVDGGEKTAQESGGVSKGAETREAKETSAEDKESGKAAKKVQSAEGRAQSEEKSSESKKKSSETRKDEPKVSDAKEALTDEQRKEKARKRAEAWLEWEKKTSPTVKELNTAREYVKEFDNLSNARRLAIIRMIRSAEGKVDKKILKGVANLMAVNPLSDLEIRFAEGLGGDKGGIAAKIGNKTVIVIDSGTDFKNTIQGTIAHELVHYLENKAGYKEFAAFVRKHAKPEAVERHRKRYTDFYRELITAQLMRGEGEVSGKYDIVVLENGNTYVTASRKIINGKTLSEKRRDISDFFTTLLNEKSSLDIQTIEGDILTITKSETADKARDNYKYVNGKRVKLADDEFIVKLHAEAHIDELAETSLKSPKSPSGDEKNHSFAKDGFTYRTAYFEDFDGQYYQVTLSVGHNGTVATVYNVGKIKESVPSSAKIIAVVGSRALDKTLSDNIISQKHDIVNPSEEKSQQNNLSRGERIPEDIKVRVEERLASAEIQELIESEITAKLAGQALNNERFLKRYADRDKKFIQKAFEWIQERVTRLKKNGKDTEEVSEIADEMAHRLIVLLQTKETTGESNDSKKYSFAGEKAKTADKMKLATAKEMLEGGVDSETVRKETGWFKSYDGKWRFEINDEEIKVSVPTSEHAKIGDIVDHPLLFEAYPELKETKIRFDDELSDATAIFYPQFNEIVLTGLLKKHPKILKETLIHEMQHVVQEIEGFAKGSSPEYWLKARRDAQLKYDSLKKDLDQWLTDIGYERFAEETKARVLAGEISPKERAKALEDFFKNPLYAEELARREAELDKLNKDRPKLYQVGDGLGISTVKDMYYATAGEIEARDAAGRSEFTDEQRKIIRPEVDWKHAVFAEDGVSYYAAKDKSAENDSVKTQLREHLNEVNTMEPVANVKYHVVNKEKAKQDTKDFYKSKGSKIDRQNFGIIEMGEREVELSSNYANTAAEFAAWQTIPSVLKRGRLISGHENHKNEGFSTYTFAAPVVINGQRGNVAVVVRKTGKYRYKMHRILMPDGSVFVYKDINENAELTGSDILLNEKEKGPDISSASTNSIPQKSDLSTHSAKKYDLADDIHNENGEVFEKKKILPGMSDTERYEILENRIIENVPSAKEIPTEMLQKIPEISSWEDINRYFKSDKKKLITKIAKEFGAIGKEFSNEDIGISFYFSGNNFQESYGKQKKNYIAFAKMFSVFDDVVQRAVGIEIHNRNDIGYKYDPTLENMYVLVSAYQDGEHIIPVKLEVKEFNDKQNTLYVAISLEKIKKTEVSEQGTTDNGVAQGSRSVNISISQLFKKINPSDKSFLKYVPKDFLDKQNDADVTATKKIKYDLADDIHNENGEVKDEFFETAVLRSLGVQNSGASEAESSLKAKSNKMRGMLEKMARESAKAAKDARAEVFAKEDVALAVNSIEGWTREEMLGLAKGHELKGMTRAKREDMISQIYIALHEQSAKGQSGPGSVAVKTFATEIASEYIDSAQVVGEDGKSYHFSDIYDEATVNGFKHELADLLYGEFSNMGKATDNAEFLQKIRVMNESFRRERLNEAMLGKDAKNVAYQAQKIREMAEKQKRDGVTESLGALTKVLGSIVDAKGNIRVGVIDKAMGEISVFLEGEKLKTQSAREGLSPEAKVTEVADVVDEELQFMVDEFRRMREGHEKKALTAEEMKLAGNILRGMKTTIERYNKEFINGHWVDVDAAAAGEVEDLISVANITKGKEYKTKIGEIFGKKVGKGVNEIYFYKILSPENVLGALESYRNGGLLQSMYHSIRVARQKAGHLAVQMKKPFEEFLDAKGEIEIELSGEEYSDSSRYEPTIDLSFDTELSTLVKDVYGSAKYKKIAQYILDVLGRKEISLSDGRLTIVDNSDALHIANRAAPRKTAKIAKIKEIIKNARLYAQDVNVDHNKFDLFYYYEATVKYDGETFPVYLNIGRAKNDGKYHIYDITNKIRDTADRINGLERPKPNEGYALKNGISNSSIHQNGVNVKSKTKKVTIDPTFVDDEGKYGRTGKKYSYRDKLNTRKVNVNGAELTLGEAIYLLMLTKREEAHAGLRENGYIVYDENNQKRLKVKIEDISAARDLIYNQLDKTDLKFLEMAEEFFNKTSSRVKHDADMNIFGYSNNIDGYYVPMIRDRYSRMSGVTDARQGIKSIVTVYNKSFTRNLVANAKALEGKNIMSIINDHADGLAEYSEMYLPLKAFDRVYNRAVAASDGEVRSIREVLNNEVWNGTEQYLKDLFKDVQGQRERRDNVVDTVVGKLRSGWVNSVLGANVKVVVTQTTSLGAATQIIEPQFITQASATIAKKDISELRERAYKYSDIIEARSFDMGALKAQGNIEKVSKIGEKSGFLIGWMDERVCLSIFHAAELKVQEQTGHAIGTEENAKRAAKIADETIYTTQAMSDATERSALQRSTSEIAKLFSMFTSDTVKNLSHTWGNLMKYQAHKARADAGDAKYAEMLKQDKAELGRSVRTLAITGLMMGLITQAFKYLYAKEEEEPEDKAKDLAIDVVSSTLNIFPIVSDIVDKLFFDYDISMNVLDVVNDTIETLGKGGRLAGKALSGEFVSTNDVTGATLGIIMSGAQLFGIPVKPVERTVTGLMRRFVPSAIYGYDAMFSNPSYTADIKKAVESGDEALAEHILSTLYKNELAGVYTSDELEEIVRLYTLTDEEGKHYNVLPQKIGTEINGVKLSAAQRKKFNAIYSQASGKVNEFIDSPYYRTLSDEQKAKGIKNIYSLYYDRAAAEVVGKEWSSAVAYSYLTDNYSALFAVQAYKSGLSVQVDNRGKKITVKTQMLEYMDSLKLSESDHLVVAYANGVRDKETKVAFLQYLNALSLSEDVKRQIAERLGFEYKDGRVVEKAE